MRATKPHSLAKYGLVLLNMGGPGKEEEIVDYLYEVFSDPYILPLPWPLRKGLAFMISRLRKKEAAERYALIGGSPLDQETQKQVSHLSQSLGMPVSYAMRYIRPSVSEAYKALADQGVTHPLVLPLYPQFSRVTTTTALENFQKHSGCNDPYRVIPNHYDHAQFIETLDQLLLESLEKVEPGLNTAVLFIAHSVPINVVRKGDPYVKEVEATVSLLTQKKTWPYPHSIAYSSKVGPVKWQGPTMDEAVKWLHREKVEQLVVQPVSFVCENLETRYDLDIELKGQCEKSGIHRLIRVPAPGVHPLYISALTSKVRAEIAQWEAQNV